MKIQDFNNIDTFNQKVSHRNWIHQGSVQAWSSSNSNSNTYNKHQALEIITATLAFLLPAILLFLIAAK